MKDFNIEGGKMLLAYLKKGIEEFTDQKQCVGAYVNKNGSVCAIGLAYMAFCKEKDLTPFEGTETLNMSVFKSDLIWTSYVGFVQRLNDELGKTFQEIALDLETKLKYEESENNEEKE